MRLLVKDPRVPFSIVFVLSIVGSGDVPQQIPLETTGAPPSLVTLPPETAVVYEISFAAAVIITGGDGLSFLQE